MRSIYIDSTTAMCLTDPRRQVHPCLAVVVPTGRHTSATRSTHIGASGSTMASSQGALRVPAVGEAAGASCLWSQSSQHLTRPCIPCLCQRRRWTSQCLSVITRASPWSGISSAGAGEVESPIRNRGRGSPEKISYLQPLLKAHLTYYHRSQMSSVTALSS